MTTAPQTPVIDRLEAATVRAEGASQQMYQFVNADEHTDIQTDSGAIPTIAKWLASQRDPIEGAMGQVLAALEDHEEGLDPHPQYATNDDLSGHSAAVDPHPQYTTGSEVGQAIDYAFPAVSNAELDEGASTERRAWSPARVRQAVIKHVPKSIETVGYDQRDHLRLRNGGSGDFVMVDGLGLFQFHPGSVEPDDDESSFAASAGRWLLKCPHWDVILSWLYPDLQSSWANSRLHGEITCPITEVLPVTRVRFAGFVDGAEVGDCVFATPPESLSASSGQGRLSFWAHVSNPNEVSISISNPSAAVAYVGGGIWRVIVFKEI